MRSHLNHQFGNQRQLSLAPRLGWRADGITSTEEIGPWHHQNTKKMAHEGHAPSTCTGNVIGVVTGDHCHPCRSTTKNSLGGRTPPRNKSRTQKLPKHKWKRKETMKIPLNQMRKQRSPIKKDPPLSTKGEWRTAKEGEEGWFARFSKLGMCYNSIAAAHFVTKRPGAESRSTPQ